MNPGDRVFISKSYGDLPSRFGTVVDVLPERGGCLVCPDGHAAHFPGDATQKFGWGFNELVLLPIVGNVYLDEDGDAAIVRYVTDDKLPTARRDDDLVIVGFEYLDANRPHMNNIKGVYDISGRHFFSRFKERPIVRRTAWEWIADLALEF